ncbi:MAG TPA: hypothetical protein VMV48_08750 [Gallionellaceae bacterium]|nr:hypothetical protein [Gallionellaceae bacterium]
MRVIAILLCLCCIFTGCASRSQIREDNQIKSAADLYNRNFVVAAPTYAGNLFCGAPFFLLSSGIDAIYFGERTESYYKFINNVYFIPASVCGAIVGAVFVPVSYVCDEHPWDFDFKTVRSRTWECR